MDMEEETRRFKWLLMAGLVFLISVYFSWRELKYLAFGKTVDARVVRLYEYTEAGEQRRSRAKIAVEYEFTDKDGTVRKETDLMLPTDPLPEGPTVPIQYLSGSADASRLPFNSKRYWLLIFVASLGFVGYKIWQLVKESKS